MDDGIYYDSIWAYQGITCGPTSTCPVELDGYADRRHADDFVTSQIQLKRALLVEREYDAVVARRTRHSTRDGADLIWKAQQIFYGGRGDRDRLSGRLEAINTAKWDAGRYL